VEIANVDDVWLCPVCVAAVTAAPYEMVKCVICGDDKGGTIETGPKRHFATVGTLAHRQTDGDGAD
jgi:hypothetical protein